MTDGPATRMLANRERAARPRLRDRLLGAIARILRSVHLRWRGHEHGSGGDQSLAERASASPDATSRRGIDVPTVGEMVQVAHYFRAAMEQRRSIALRAFFASTGFDVLLTKGVLDYSQLRTYAGLALARIGIAAGVVLYIALIVNIERVNWRGEQSYRTIEDDLRRRLGAPEPENGFPITRSGWQAMRGSWSGIWPALAAAGVALACLVFLSTLPVLHSGS